MKKVKKTVKIFSILAVMILLVGMSGTMSNVKAIRFVPASVYATGPPTVTPGNIKYFSNGGFISWDWGFSIPNAMWIGSREYDTLSVSTFGGVYVPSTDTLTLHFNVVWTVGSYPWDGFRGQLVIIEYNYNAVTETGNPDSVYVVAHGFGTFEGMPLILSYYGPNQVTGTWTGYVIEP